MRISSFSRAAGENEIPHTEEHQKKEGRTSQKMVSSEIFDQISKRDHTGVSSVAPRVNIGVANFDRNASKMSANVEVGNLPAFGGFFKKKSTGQSSSSGRGEESSTLPMFRLRHVPYVSQEDDRTGCWYACCRMLGYSVASGPRLGLPELFDPNHGHSHLQSFEHVERLLANEGLERVMNFPPQPAPVRLQAT
ncbi:hypothetical protein [Paracidovorax citrulli]|uniref:hypothetical protein n=1 Tax=Paracidovorax citrulli TaxID=80869 RepID=UPI00126A4D55|nr:hypothetical protein [Paracidovorax citrulli]